MVSIKLDASLLDVFVKEYQQYSEPNNGEYIYFFAKKGKLVITLYQSKKGYKVLFDGPSSLEEAKKWDKEAAPIVPKKHVVTDWLCLEDQIGSDEVGVGDLVLPIVVAAAYVKKEDIPFLLELGVKDSKKMKDDEILDVVPLLINKINVSKLTLSTEKYNELITKGENLNSIKAKMHNQALKNLKNKHSEVDNIFVDEFVKEETYFKYLATSEPLRGITFKTKGESYYPSVAVGSLIARYSFLKEKEKLENKYGMTFPLGAGKKADEFAIKFIEKYGIEEFDKIVKKNFANYDEVIKLI